MNFTRKTLLSAVAMLSKIVENRPTLPILSHITLQQKDHVLHMTGTNLELYLTLDITPTTPDPERLGDPIAVPAKEFLVVLKSLREDIVSLKSIVGENLSQLSVSGVTIEGLPIEEFPAGEPDRLEVSVAMPGLTEAISRVATAKSWDESRYAICGVYVDAKAGHVAATDSHRLYRAVIAPGHGFKGSLHGQFADLLGQPAFKKFVTQDILYLGPSPAQRTFVPISGPGLTGWFSARVIEGTFPSYEQIIPKDESAKTTLTIKTAALLAGLAKAAAVAESRTRMVELILEGGRIQILGKSERGQAQIDLDGSATGEDLIIGVNGHYLKDALESCTSDTVTFLFNDWDKPMWLHDGVAPKKTPGSMRLDIVIMPMRSRERERKVA